MKNRTRLQRLVAFFVVLPSVFVSFLIYSYNLLLIHNAVAPISLNHDSGSSGVSFDDIHRKHFESAPERIPGVYLAGSVKLENPTQAKLELRQGAVYSARDYAKMRNYTLIRPADMDKWRDSSPYQSPRQCTQQPAKNPWLIEFRGVWMNNRGDILVPERTNADGKVIARHYAMSGGISRSKWGYVPGNTIVLTGKPEDSVCRHRLAFSMHQYDGSTYYHVVTETLPRFFAFWKAAMMVIEEGGQLLSNGGLLTSFLRSFGVRREHLSYLGNRCYFDRLLIPEPFLLGTYPHQCHNSATQSALRDHFLEDVRLPQRPLVLFIERASARFANGTCTGSRCLANLPQLKQAVIREMGDIVQVESFRGNVGDVLRTAAHMFHRATVVIGVHGAGFSNIIYMRGPGTSVIELVRREDPIMYSSLSYKYRVDYRSVLTYRECHYCPNVWADIPAVILEVRRALARTGLQLPPPVLSTNATRNAELVRLSPCSKTPSDQLKRYTLEQCPSVKGPQLDIQPPYPGACNSHCARFLRLGYIL